MNDLERSAMEQALEALEAYATHQRLPGPCPVRDAEYALRAALAKPEPPIGKASTDVGVPVYVVKKAEPVQEPQCKPVAWMHTDPDNPRVKFLVWRENEPAYRGVWIKTPLYAAPPPRKPLSEEEIGIICASLGFAQISPVEVARAIERAHGIT